MAVDAGTVTVLILVAGPSLGMGVDVIVEVGVTLHTHRVRTLVMTGSAVGNLATRDLTMEVRRELIREPSRVRGGRSLSLTGNITDPMGTVAGFAIAGAVASETERGVVARLDEVPGKIVRFVNHRHLNPTVKFLPSC